MKVLRDGWLSVEAPGDCPPAATWSEVRDKLRYVLHEAFEGFEHPGLLHATLDSSEEKLGRLLGVEGHYSVAVNAPLQCSIDALRYEASCSCLILSRPLRADELHAVLEGAPKDFRNALGALIELQKHLQALAWLLPSGDQPEEVFFDSGETETKLGWVLSALDRFLTRLQLSTTHLLRHVLPPVEVEKDCGPNGEIGSSEQRALARQILLTIVQPWHAEPKTSKLEGKVPEVGLGFSTVGCLIGGGLKQEVIGLKDHHGHLAPNENTIWKGKDVNPRVRVVTQPGWAPHCLLDVGMESTAILARWTGRYYLEEESFLRLAGELSPGGRAGFRVRLWKAKEDESIEEEKKEEEYETTEEEKKGGELPLLIDFACWGDVQVPRQPMDQVRNAGRLPRGLYRLEVLYYDLEGNGDGTGTFRLKHATASHPDELDCGDEGWAVIAPRHWYHDDSDLKRSDASVNCLRGTWQRIYKVMLLTQRLGFGPEELAYFARTGEHFTGLGYSHDGKAWKSLTNHLNLPEYPVEEYYPDSNEPTLEKAPRNIYARMDQWERLTDYATLRDTLACCGKGEAWKALRDANGGEDAAPILCRLLGVSDVVAQQAVKFLTKEGEKGTLKFTKFTKPGHLARAVRAVHWQSELVERFGKPNKNESSNFYEWGTFELEPKPRPPFVWDYLFGPISKEQEEEEDLKTIDQYNAKAKDFFEAVYDLKRLKYFGADQRDIDSAEKSVADKKIKLGKSETEQKWTETIQKKTAGTTLAKGAIVPVGVYQVLRSSAYHALLTFLAAPDISPDAIRRRANHFLVTTEFGSRNTRVKEWIEVLHRYIKRAMLGEEATLSPETRKIWKEKFEDRCRWEDATLRDRYPENFLDVENGSLARSRKTEAGAVLQRRLQEDTLSIMLEKPAESETKAETFIKSFHALQLLMKMPQAFLTDAVSGKLATTFRLPAESHATKNAVEISNASTFLDSLWGEVGSGYGMNPVRWYQDLSKASVRVQAYGDRFGDYFFWLVESSSTELPNPKQEDEWEATALVGQQRMVRLAWCQRRDSQWTQTRYSDVGMLLLKKKDDTYDDPTITFWGRYSDSLVFEVGNGTAEAGTKIQDAKGKTDVVKKATLFEFAIRSEQVRTREEKPKAKDGVPYFLNFNPGHPSRPLTDYPILREIADYQRSLGRFDSALEWLSAPVPVEEGQVIWEKAGQAEKKDRVLRYVETLLEATEAALVAGGCTSAYLNRAEKILGPRPPIVASTKADNEECKESELGVSQLNPRLLLAWDRLSLLQLRNREQLEGHCQPSSSSCRRIYRRSPYRFEFLHRTAEKYVNELIRIDGKLQSAFAGEDNEHAAAMRANHDAQILNRTLDIRQQQLLAADWDVQALEKTLESTRTRLKHTQKLIRDGLNEGESDYLDLMKESKFLMVGAEAAELAAQTVLLIPETEAHAGTCSGTTSEVSSGFKSSQYIRIGAHALRAASSYQATEAQIRATNGSNARRLQEWRHQEVLLKIEEKQVLRNLRGAERRRRIALLEVRNHQQQMENAEAVRRFAADKFTNAEYHRWMKGECAGLLRQAYHLAMSCCIQAEAAFRYERDFTDETFIRRDAWKYDRDGIMAGDYLMQDLNRMYEAYTERNTRPNQLMESFSLREWDPAAFVEFRNTGACIFDIHEWMFDMGHAGHYLRRIKSVSLTIPAVTTSRKIPVTLKLMRHKTRLKPFAGCDAYPDQGVGDERFYEELHTREQLATSGGVREDGLFELRFQDERYLPFEGAGVVSRWKIEMPERPLDFDRDSLTDISIEINFESRTGTQLAKKAADEAAWAKLPSGDSPWQALVHCRQDFRGEWSRLVSECDESCERELCLELDESFFPKFGHGRKVEGITAFALIIESCPNTAPSPRVLIPGAPNLDLHHRGSSEGIHEYAGCMSGEEEVLPLGQWRICCSTAPENIYLVLEYTVTESSKPQVKPDGCKPSACS